MEPAEEDEEPKDLSRFMQSFGAWQDERPVKATLTEADELAGDLGGGYLYS